MASTTCPTPDHGTTWPSRTSFGEEGADEGSGEEHRPAYPIRLETSDHKPPRTARTWRALPLKFAMMVPSKKITSHASDGPRGGTATVLDDQ